MEHAMHSTPLHSHDATTGAGLPAESFDDDPANHPAATAGEEHPSADQDSVMEYYRRRIFVGTKAVPVQTRSHAKRIHDR
jgi:hypothetical protein